MPDSPLNSQQKHPLEIDKPVRIRNERACMYYHSRYHGHISRSRQGSLSVDKYADPDYVDHKCILSLDCQRTYCINI